MDASNFQLFIVLMDNPFKINLQFFQNDKVAKAFIEVIFEYISKVEEYSHSKEDPSKSQWIDHVLNKNLLIAFCDLLNYCSFKHL